MAGFSFDSKLYSDAISKMDAALDSFTGLKESILDVSISIPSGYEYRKDIESICTRLNDVDSFVNKYDDHLHKNSSLLSTNFSDRFSSVSDEKNSNLEFDSESFMDALKKTGATVCVGTTSVLNAFFKITEMFSDAELGIKGFTLAGISKVMDLFKGTDTASKIIDSTLDEIRRDKVGEYNKYFYENTKAGKNINKLSALKYDSEEAQKITNVSGFLAKLALATGATIATGGVAAPIALGAFYGTGSALEKYSSKVDRENGEQYNYTKAIIKSVTGAATGAVEWWGYAGLGKLGLVGKNAIANLLNAGGKMSLSTLKSSALNLVKSQSVKTFGTNYLKELFAKDNILDSTAVITDDLVDYFYGDITKAQLVEDFKWELGLGAVFSSLGAFGRGINDAKINKSFVDDSQLINKSIIVDNSGPIWKVKVGDQIVDMPKEIFESYKSNGGIKLKEFLLNNFDIDKKLNFYDGIYDELAYKLEKGFKGNPNYSSVKINKTYNSIFFENLEKKSVFLLETSGGKKYRIHSNEEGFGRIYAFERKAIFENDVFDFIFNQEITDIKFLGKQSEVYDFAKYRERLTYDGDVYGVDQGSICRNIKNMSAEEIDQLVDIVSKNIPGIEYVDAVDFLTCIDAYAGVCSYAAPLNMFLQNNKIIYDEEIFKRCFGFDFKNKTTGNVNTSYLLADFYSYVNRNNNYFFSEKTYYDSFGNEHVRKKFLDLSFYYDDELKDIFGQQIYISGREGPYYYNGSNKYKDNIFIDYINSRLEKGISEYGYDKMKNYRVTIQPTRYYHRADKTEGVLGSFHNNYGEGLNGSVFDSSSLINNDDLDETNFVSSMKNGRSELGYGKTEENSYLPMYKLDGRSDMGPVFMLGEGHPSGGHSMSILDYTGDGFVVQSWGGIWYIDKHALSEDQFEIYGYNCT